MSAIDSVEFVKRALDRQIHVTVGKALPGVCCGRSNLVFEIMICDRTKHSQIENISLNLRFTCAVTLVI